MLMLKGTHPSSSVAVEELAVTQAASNNAMECCLIPLKLLDLGQACPQATGYLPSCISLSFDDLHLLGILPKKEHATFMILYSLQNLEQQHRYSMKACHNSFSPSIKQQLSPVCSFINLAEDSANCSKLAYTQSAFFMTSMKG